MGEKKGLLIHVFKRNILEDQNMFAELRIEIIKANLGELFDIDKSKLDLFYKRRGLETFVK